MSIATCRHRGRTDMGPESNKTSPLEVTEVCFTSFTAECDLNIAPIQPYFRVQRMARGGVNSKPLLVSDCWINDLDKLPTHFSPAQDYSKVWSLNNIENIFWNICWNIFWNMWSIQRKFNKPNKFVYSSIVCSCLPKRIYILICSCLPKRIYLARFVLSPSLSITNS